MIRPTLTACIVAAVVATVACHANAKPGSSTVNLADNSVAIDVRIQQAKALAKDPAPNAVDVLLGGLDSRSEPLRDAIIASLKTKRGDVVLLQRAADTKRPAEARVAALAGIRVLKPAGAGPKLGALLADADDSVREAAALALCVVGTGAAEAPLVARLAIEPSAKVRSFLATALGELKTPAAKAAIAARQKVEADVVVKDALDQAETKQAQPN